MLRCSRDDYQEGGGEGGSCLEPLRSIVKVTPTTFDQRSLTEFDVGLALAVVMPKSAKAMCKVVEDFLGVQWL